MQEKLEKVNQEIKQKTEELDNKRGEKINAENEKNLIKQNISNLTSNYKSIAERKQQIALEISEFKAKQRFLEKDMSENQVKKPYDKSFLTQTKKKLDANNKEINNLQQKRLSLINEQKTLESNELFYKVENLSIINLNSSNCRKSSNISPNQN